MDASIVFAVVAGIIIIGFVGEFFFRKTSIPIFISLIITGIILGPVLNIFPRQSVIPVLAPVAELTLLLVLFSSGLSLKARVVIENGGRALVQAAIYIGLSSILIGSLGVFIMKWGVLPSFIFASMISGETTAALLVPLSKWMRISESVSSFLKIEAATNSILLVVLFFAFVQVYNSPGINLSTAFNGVASQFSVGIVVGAILSLTWVYTLYRFQKEKFTYILTLGLILITYAVATQLGGNGTLSVLVFGLVFGNYYLVNKLFRRQMNLDFLQNELGAFQQEISFLLTTLLFVFLGVAFVITPSHVVTNVSVALAILLILLTCRFVATRVSTFKSQLSTAKREILLMCAQGVTPATLAILAVSLQLPYADTFVNIVTYVIIMTNVITTAVAVASARKHKTEL
ncbi:MAG TPA: cation:proton antiporter [Candidatus Nanoarchaeia archaeon]|nr:cation:proton antiporter [Candidatus Nanoarchaeia archaeon]